MPVNTLITQDVDGNLVEIVAEAMEGGFRAPKECAGKLLQTYKLATGEPVDPLGDGQFQNLQTGMIYKQIDEAPEKS